MARALRLAERGAYTTRPNPMARRPQLEAFAREHGLKMGSIEDLIRHRLATEHTVERVDSRAIDTAYGPFRLFSYRDRM